MQHVSVSLKALIIRNISLWPKLELRNAQAGNGFPLTQRSVCHTSYRECPRSMLRVMQKMLPLQAAVPRPRYLSCLPHHSSTDRDAHGRPPTNNSKWKSSLVLGTAAAAVTFATLTRVMGFLSGTRMRTRMASFGVGIAICLLQMHHIDTVAERMNLNLSIGWQLRVGSLPCFVIQRWRST